jgi:hypothetical protein
MKWERTCYVEKAAGTCRFLASVAHLALETMNFGNGITNVPAPEYGK